MYQLSDNDGPSSNDYFETMQAMDDFMNRLATLEHEGDSSKESFIKSLLENLVSLHPFGWWSLDWAHVHFVWQNACCALVTLYVSWIFLMPRAIKKMMDHMVCVGKKRALELRGRLTKANLGWGKKPSAPEEEPAPPLVLAQMQYQLTAD